MLTARDGVDVRVLLPATKDLPWVPSEAPDRVLAHFREKPQASQF